MLDRFNRTINYLRISVTDMCDLRCPYCQGVKDFVHKKHKDILSYEQFRDITIVAAELGITKVRLTGGEPLIRKNIEALVRYIADIEGIKELTMTTNGTRLAEKADILKQSGLDRINISLDTLDPDLYTELTGGGTIECVLEGIQAARTAGFSDTKINMVIIPGKNNHEISAMRKFCEKHSLSLQLIRLFSLSETKISGTDQGYDRPPSCEECNKLRLLADGTLKPCLHTDVEFKIDLNDIKGSLFLAVEMKPKQGDTCNTRPMTQIGG